MDKTLLCDIFSIYIQITNNFPHLHIEKLIDAQSTQVFQLNFPFNRQIDHVIITVYTAAYNTYTSRKHKAK